MKYSTFITRNAIWGFALSLGAIFLYGILSINRHYPSRLGMEINLCIAGALAITMFLFLFFNPIKYLTQSSLIFFTFMLLIGLQPLINTIYYPQALIFPIACLLLVGILAIVIGNCSEYDKNQVILPVLLSSLMLGSALVVGTQMAQVFHWDNQFSFIRNSSRPISNLAQPNQTAYVLTLGAASAMYFLFRSKHWAIKLFLYALILWFFIGVGLSSSRGGLILGIASIFAMSIFVKRPWRQKLIKIIMLLGVFALAYAIANYLLKHQAGLHATAFYRYAEHYQRLGSEDANVYYNARLFLQIEAWTYFKDHWLTGVGWANFARSGIDYASDIAWIPRQHHSHFFLSHIAAELGVLGIAPLFALVLIVINKLRINLNDQQSIIATLIGLSVLYSMSEHPMWYLRYLFLFVIFIALWDSSRINVKYGVRILLMLICLGVAMSSAFYYQRYQQYAQTYYTIGLDYFSPAQKIQLFKQLPRTFGFNHYVEFMRYRRLPINVDELNAEERQSMLAVGERLMTVDVSMTTLLKQADLWTYEGQKDKALKWYKVACAIRRFTYCKSVEKHLQSKKTQNFQYIYQKFEEWRMSNFSSHH